MKALVYHETTGFRHASIPYAIEGATPRPVQIAQPADEEHMENPRMAIAESHGLLDVAMFGDKPKDRLPVLLPATSRPAHLLSTAGR